MKNAIRNPERYFSRRAVGAWASRARYKWTGRIWGSSFRRAITATFSTQWRAYLAAGSVVPYKDLTDASHKLNTLSGNLSPLLSMLCLASQNVAVDDPAVANVFQPVTAVVPPGCAERYIAPANQTYMNSLVTLQASVDGAAKAPGDDAIASQSVNNATAAKIAARQLAQNFRIDPEGHTDATVLKLLLDPDHESRGRLSAPWDRRKLNAAGKALCGQMSPVWRKYPFNVAAKVDATEAEVNAIFRKPDGALWKLYESVQKVLTKQGAQYVVNPAGGVSLTPGFVAFFNQAAALSEALYAGNTPSPHFSYSLKPVPSEGNIPVTLTFDGQTLSYAGRRRPVEDVPMASCWSARVQIDDEPGRAGQRRRTG